MAAGAGGGRAEQGRGEGAEHEGAGVDEGAGDHAERPADEDQAELSRAQHGSVPSVVGGRLDGRGDRGEQALDDVLGAAALGRRVAREQQAVRDTGTASPPTSSGMT